MKNKILELHHQGFSYSQIQNILHCSRGLISYYVNPEGKTKTLNRQNRNRLRRKKEYKMLAGGKCEICGYNKCFRALHFHHKKPQEKLFEISSALWGQQRKSEEEILNEIKKCILVCANCHAEIHENNY